MKWLVKYKDTVTNVCGLVILVCPAVLAAPVTLPAGVVLGLKVAVVIAGALVGYLTGKQVDNGTV